MVEHHLLDYLDAIDSSLNFHQCQSFHLTFVAGNIEKKNIVNKKNSIKKDIKVFSPVAVASHYFAKFDLDFADELFDLQHYLDNVEHPIVQLELNFHLEYSSANYPAVVDDAVVAVVGVYAVDAVAFVMFDVVMVDAVTVDVAIVDANGLYSVVADDVAVAEHLHLVVATLEFAFVSVVVIVQIIVAWFEPAIVNAIEIVVIAEPEIVEAVVVAMNVAVFLVTGI